MKIAISIGSAYYDGHDWEEMLEFVEAADAMGIDSVWSAEAWGMDAVVALGVLAGRTKQIRLGTGIMQISARTPASTAMTAMSLDRVSNGRFLLGLGASGPQVVEGLHGLPFAKPMSRMREYVEIVRMATAGERLRIDGEHLVLPRPGGEGKALRLSMPPKRIPIYLATLGVKSLEMTGEIADGWLGTSFIPEQADAHLAHIAKGAERAGRSLDDIEIEVNSMVAVSDDVEGLLDRTRQGMAFTLGAMGSARTNFYNDAYCRSGWEEVSKEVQRLWIGGDKKAAIAAVPDEMLLQAYLIGTEDRVRERIRAFRDAGVDVFRLAPQGRTVKERIANLEYQADLIRSETS
ncbi:MAG: LLM class flavin-dependent oxidoreductase [bacterium]|nr:LLM class flavin-dependent oxidoreductase [bacterium]